jgi:hypothetical protein
LKNLALCATNASDFESELYIVYSKCVHHHQKLFFTSSFSFIFLIYSAAFGKARGTLFLFKAKQLDEQSTPSFLMLYLFPFNDLKHHEILLPTTRRKRKKSKLQFVLSLSVIVALCFGCLLDALVVMQFELEVESYTEEDHSFDEEFVYLLRGDTPNSLHQHARNLQSEIESIIDPIDIQVPPFSREESFAGCLLLLDQNHRLTEWIAYHYFALPLRTLFIAYDPKTRDRATELIERWKHVINIVEWDDEDYLPVNWTSTLVSDQKQKASLVAHRKRQLSFYQKCHERSVEMGIQRTLLLDPDEYLRINPDVIPSAIVNTNEPGHITKLYQLLEDHNNTLLTEQEGVTYNANCSVYPRVQYTTMAPNQLYSVPRDIEFSETGLVDPFYYNTLRYRYRNMYRMKHPKAILNAMHHVPHEIVNLHFPLDLKCNKSAFTLDKSPFLINHYIGSFGDFLHAFHSDARNDGLNYADLKLRYEMRSRGRGHDHPFDFHFRNPLVKDESITNWVPAFFAWQSDAVAKVLLRDSGIRALNLNL